MRFSLFIVLVALAACAAPSSSRLDGDADRSPSAPGGSDGGHSGGGFDSAGGAGGAGSSGDVGGDPGSGGAAGGAVDPGCDGYPFSAAALYAERVGFGASTSGGDPDLPYHVTTLASSGPGSLAHALESTEPFWIVFDVQGTIVLPAGEVDVESHKTIDGRGRDITIEGSLKISHQKDIIVTDVRLTNDLEGQCSQGGDVIAVRGNGTEPASYTAKNLWFHHLELFHGGDGLLDLRGASGVTVSWSHLHDHKKAMLMWKNADQSPAYGMRVTLHHNFFDRLTLRGPQFVYGWAHFFNNYQFEWYEYGAGGLGDAQFASESNIYQARPGSYCLPSCPDPNPCGDNDFTVSKAGLVSDWSGNGVGRVRSMGDLALEGAVLEEHEPSTVFNPSDLYDYTADVASESLATSIRAGSGPRTNYCQ